MQISPYRFALILVRVAALYCLLAPVLELSRGIYVYFHSAIGDIPGAPSGGSLFNYYVRDAFIPPLVPALIIWFCAPWLARLLAGTRKHPNSTDEGGK